MQELNRGITPDLSHQPSLIHSKAFIFGDNVKGDGLGKNPSEIQVFFRLFFQLEYLSLMERDPNQIGQLFLRNLLYVIVFI